MSPVVRALGLAALLSVRKYGVWSTPLQRFFYHWSPRDTVAFLASFTLIALAIFGAEWATRRIPGPLGARIRRAGFLLLTLVAVVSLVATPGRFLSAVELVAGVLLAFPVIVLTGGSAAGRRGRAAIAEWGARASARGRGLAWMLLPVGALLLVILFPPTVDLVRAAISPAPGWVAWVALTVVVAGVWHAAGPEGWGIVAGAQYAISIASPLAVLIVLHALFWSTWSPRSSSTLASPPGSTGAPIVLVIFDEWSRSSILTDAGAVRPGHPGAAELAAKGVTLSQARSPGAWTFDAMPRLLVGRDGELAIRSDGAVWVDSAGVRPFSEAGHLIARARAKGYRVRVSGYYLPYARLFEGELSQVYAYPSVRKPRSLAGAILVSLRRTLYYWQVPGGAALFRREGWWGLEPYDPTWYRVQDALADSAVAALGTLQPGELVIIHLPTPHPPLTRGPDGAFVPQPPVTAPEALLAAYASQVRYTDGLLQRLWDAMGRSGARDSALIVVTSDHAWRSTPDSALRAPERLIEVPLWLAWPGAPGGTTDARPLCTTGLAALFDLALEGSGPLRARGSEALDAAMGSTACRPQAPPVWTSIWF